MTTTIRNSSTADQAIAPPATYSCATAQQKLADACHPVAPGSSSSFKRPPSGRAFASLCAFGTVIGLLAGQPLVAQQQPIPKVDVTFAFIADPHSSYNGINDYEWYQRNYIDVTNPSSSQVAWANNMIAHEAANNGCLSVGQADLCNLVQEVRKLNAVSNPVNSWPNGMSIAPLAGVVVGGDMTDCGGGGDAPSINIHGYNRCGDYNNGYVGAQLAAFVKLFDNSRLITPPVLLGPMPFLRGLTNPDVDVPLRYPIFPGFGNHDLNFADSSDLQHYVSQWYAGLQMPGTKIDNSDSGSKSYSWDWGGLHLVNVGVFAGSDDSDYQYSNSSIQWLQSDLQKFAGDGRPVMIFQHFGFDPVWGLTSSWYDDPNRITGLQGLFDAIKKYNVIGIFTGHNHDSLYNYQYPSLTSYNSATQSWVPQDANGLWHPAPNSVWPDWTQSVPPSQHVPELPLTVYDIFHPGAAFSQKFAVVHVTNSELEVMYADNAEDFNNSTKKITFKYDFKKFLAPTPFVSSLPTPGTLLYPASTTVQVNQQNFLVTAGYGAFKVAQLNSNGTNTPTDAQAAIAMGLGTNLMSPQLTSAPDGSVFACQGEIVAMFNVVNGKLQLKWLQTLSASADQIMGFTLQNQTYLLAYRNSDALATFYKVNNAANVTSHLSPVLSRNMDQALAPLLGVPITYRTAQLISYPENNAVADPNAPARFLRYDPALGGMEYYAFQVTNNTASLSDPVSDGTWAPRATLIQPFQDQNHDTQFLVVSNPCAQGTTEVVTISATQGVTKQLPTYCSPESPFMVRKLMEGNTSTDVAWRGYPASVDLVQILGGNGSTMAATFLNYDSMGGAVLQIATGALAYNFTLPLK